MSKEIRERFHEAIKLKGVTYDVITTNDGKFLVSEQGILGHNDVLIPWGDIAKYANQYSRYKLVSYSEYQKFERWYAECGDMDDV